MVISIPRTAPRPFPLVSLHYQLILMFVATVEAAAACLQNCLQKQPLRLFWPLGRLCCVLQEKHSRLTWSCQMAEFHEGREYVSITRTAL